MTRLGWGRRMVFGAALAAIALLGACNGDESAERNRLPGFVSGSVRTTAYDGASDDLLTAGLGKTGLGPATAGGQFGSGDSGNAYIDQLMQNGNVAPTVISFHGYGYWDNDVDDSSGFIVYRRQLCCPIAVCT